jgi:hypothetical protein
VLGSEDGTTYATLGAGLVFRVVGDEQLLVGVTPAGRRWLRLQIDDGDATPLALAGVRLEWPAQELVFDAAAAGPHQVLVGAAAARAPTYDLPAVLARAPDLRTAPATLGPVGPNPAYRPAEELVPFTERHRGPLGALLLVLLAGLGLVAFRLLRAPAGSG